MFVIDVDLYPQGKDGYCEKLTFELICRTKFDSLKKIDDYLCGSEGTVYDVVSIAEQRKIIKLS